MTSQLPNASLKRVQEVLEAIRNDQNHRKHPPEKELVAEMLKIIEEIIEKHTLAPFWLMRIEATFAIIALTAMKNVLERQEEFAKTCEKMRKASEDFLKTCIHDIALRTFAPHELEKTLNLLFEIPCKQNDA
ncbi:MAG TPA: hypothetical protein VNJ47_09490 [Nevskiales bacterium]|nr:hypothetical protein [Nevskiales bacterium]